MGFLTRAIQKKWIDAKDGMIKHAALSAILAALLAGALVYCISPGEVQIAWSIARNRISTQASDVQAETLHRGIIDRVSAQPAVSRAARKIAPDPFRPFASHHTTAPSRFVIWLKGPEAVAVWLSIVAASVAAMFYRKRQFKFAMQQKMAITLSKAVRQM
jgi:hypothetical protein